MQYRGQDHTGLVWTRFAVQGCAPLVLMSCRSILQLFSVRSVAIQGLPVKYLKAEKYTAIWQPGSDLPEGYYFIALKVNDLQVHYQKVIKRK